MPTIQFDTNEDVATTRFPRFRVRIAQNWDDEWQDAPYLEPIEATDCAAPTVPRAVLRYRCGPIKREDSSDTETVTPLDLLGWFVQIELLAPENTTNDPGAIDISGSEDRPREGSRVWTGYVAELSQDVYGKDKPNSADQTFIAYGLEHLLDRDTIHSAWVETTDDVVEIGQTLVFNDRFVYGLCECGNRSIDPVGGETLEEVYVFGNSSFTWTAKNIIEYLLDGQELGWQLDGSGGVLEALDAYRPPRLDPAGKSAYQIINELVNHKRGLGWCVRLHDDGTTPVVHVFSVLDEQVRTSGDSQGFTVPANTETLEDFDVDQLPNLDRCNLSLDNLSRYGQIVVLGSPVTVCFTVSYKDETLRHGWNDDEEAAYKEGAGLAVGATNSAGVRLDAAQINDDVRNRHQLRKVYSWHLLPEDWDWKAGNGGGEADHSTKRNVNLSLSKLGTIKTDGKAPPVRTWGKRLLNMLPIPKDRLDLSDEDEFSGDKAEFKRPFAVIKNVQPNHQGFVYTHKLSGVDISPARLRMLHEAFGFELESHFSHQFARERFDVPAPPADGSAKPSKLTKPKLTFTEIIATVAAETDTRLRVTVDVPNSDSDRVLTIEVADAELWYIVPGTVVDLDANGALRRQGGNAETCTVRDDSERLQAVCALAAAWYGKDRRKLTLQLRELQPNEFPVGMYVKTITQKWNLQQVNAVITRKRYDFQRGTTDVDTGWGELDFSQR